MKVTLFVCISLVHAIIVNAALNCTELDFINTTTVAVDGADLKYCSYDGEQCCSDVYLQSRYDDINSTITSNIQAEIDVQFNRLGDVVDQFETYLRDTFVGRFSRNFCSGLITTEECDTAINLSRQSFLNHLYINDDETTDYSEMQNENSGFNSARLVSEYLSDSINGIMDNYLSAEDLTQEQRTCIYENSLATPQQERYVYDNLTEVRKSFTALRRLRSHLNTTILPNLRTLRPTDTCIESMINISCRACREDIPNTCRGVCEALTIGCFAPFRDGIGKQFDIMWNVTRLIVNYTNSLIPNAIVIPRTGFGIDINNANAVRTLAEECGVTLTTGTASNNDGGTTNDNDGGTSNDNDGGTSNDNDGGTSNDNDDDNDDALDDILEIAEDRFEAGAFNEDQPSRCDQYSNDNCWNGTSNVTMNNVAFTNKTVAGQQFNPVASYNVTILQNFSDNMDMFVTGFLQSPYFTGVAPCPLSNCSYNNFFENINGSNNSASIISYGYTLFFAPIFVGWWIN